jgi:hypothetical protein
MPGTPFRTSATVDLDATGAGEVSLRPPGLTWIVQGTSVETSTSVLHPTATVAINGGFVEGTYSGHRDGSNTVHRLTSGDVLSCTWDGGDVGARAILRAWGMQYPDGQAP